MSRFSRKTFDRSPNRRALLKAMLEEANITAASLPKITPRGTADPSEPALVSFAQQRLWLIEQFTPGTAAYNLPSALHLTGVLDVAALHRSINAIVRRHETLRTTLRTIDGRPFQIIAESLDVPLPLIDLSAMADEQRQAELGRLILAEAQQPFDLTSGPLLRTTLFRLSEREHTLLLNLHHIVFDGWSSTIFVRELGAFYAAYAQAAPDEQPHADLAPLAIQYADFAAWQQSWLQGEVLEQQLAYWKAQLANLATLELPTDRPRPAVQTFGGKRQTYLLPAPLRDALSELSQREGVTLFMTLLAAYATLLHRYSGQTDIAVGTPIAGRNRSEVAELIGFFVNTLVLRADLSDNPTFRELLQQVRETTLAAYAHQDLPFEKLVEVLQPERDLSRAPLFQCLLALQNATTMPHEIGELAAEWEEIDKQASTFDLSFSLRDLDEGLQTIVEYKTDLFNAATIDRLFGHFQTLLEAVVADADQRVGAMPLLTAAERQQMLVAWNATAAPYAQDRCAHELFEEIAARTPDAVALVFVGEAGGPHELTYGELNARANQLARYLRDLGVGPEMLVGMCVDRSFEMVIGLLAVFKAGGAYVPLDSAYPADRLALMLEDAQVSVLLTQEKHRDKVAQHAVRVVYVDSEWPTIAEQPSENLVNVASPLNAAYVIYTSGSTGRPKGTLLEHRRICNLVVTEYQFFKIQPDSRVLQFASLSFDGSLFEITTALWAGARLYLASRDSLMPGPGLVQLLRENRITNLTCPPSVLASFPEGELPDLRMIVVVGEACPVDLVTRWAPGRQFANSYGPTEATAWSTAHLCEPNGQKPLIGGPVANFQFYVLDAYQQPVPVGVPGELYIGGEGLARGYLRRPALTAEKFVPNPFSVEPGTRLYRTGDQVRWMPDGNLDFLGRIDFQVKVRGFRIEPGEIEVVLSQHAAVRECLVMARERTASSKYLVAYVIPEQGQTPTVETLRTFLQQQLPDYMVPSAFVLLPAWPLTPNGKIDRRALPAPQTTRPDLGTEYVAPANPIEETVASIWSQLLGLEQIGTHDNFFTIGGHSLLGTQFIAQVQKALQVQLPLRVLFEKPTIVAIAEEIAKIKASGVDPESLSIKRVDRDRYRSGAAAPEPSAPKELKLPRRKFSR